MNKNRTKSYKNIIVLAVIMVAIAGSYIAHRNNNEKPIIAQEYPVHEIPLAAGISLPAFEYSGLAWFGDTLVLLPQYPNGIMGDRTGFLYGIDKEQLIEWKKNPGHNLKYFNIPFNDAGFSRSLNGFEGFEAILFREDEVFLTIETHGGDPMKSFLVKGSIEWIDAESFSIVLREDNLIELPQQNRNSNASYEALTSDGEFIYALYEQYGENVNENPVVIKIKRDLTILEEIPIESINFRITDASLVNAEGEFWVINYFYPGDAHLHTGKDSISDHYGLPESHQNDQRVERLVKFRLNFTDIEIVEESPVYLELLANEEARNWEGLVSLDDNSFLIITDKYPESILGMVIIE